MILIVVTGGIMTMMEDPLAGPYVDPRRIPELLAMSAAGTLLFVWWIVPAGMMFEFFIKPRIPTSNATAALTRGAFAGAVLGLLTAMLFAGASAEDMPALTVRTSFIVFPLYCSVWCAWYSWNRASQGGRANNGGE